jgi:hypothetical protein
MVDGSILALFSNEYNAFYSALQDYRSAMQNIAEGNPWLRSMKQQ